AVVREAVDVGLLVDSGEQLLFRHELIRQALAENVPATARSALHLQAAQALAERGGQVERVAQHLLAGDIVHDWVLDWAMRGALNWLLAQACFQQGRLRNAQEVAENALAAGPLTTLETARFQHFAAQCRLLRGQIDPAPEEATAQAVLARGDADSTAVGLYYM